MLLEGNIGCDASLLANAADLAAANARAQQAAAGTDLVPLTAAVPSGLTGPTTSLVLAAALITVEDPEGLVHVTFDWYFTDSAADTLTVVIQEIPLATAITGGSTIGGWHVENGGAAVVVTGGGPSTIETLSKSVTTGALTAAFNANFYTLGGIGTQIGIQLVVSATHNLSAMVLNASLSSN